LCWRRHLAAAAAQWLSDAMAMTGLINLARRHCHCLPRSIDVVRQKQQLMP